MYILKNSIINIVRTKGRNILIGLIILIISLASCIGLSIRQAAQTAKSASLELLNITAQISLDRNALMQNSTSQGTAPFDKSKDKSYFQELMNSYNLTLDDLKTYAEAPSVEDFYYSASIGLNGSDELEPIDNSSSSNSSLMGMMGGNKNMGLQNDFSIIGYSSHEAMTQFTKGTATMVSGDMFSEGAETLDCMVSDELATYNNLSVGNTIVLSNPSDETQTFTLNIKGIYNNSQSTVTSSMPTRGSSTSNDPANQIYVDYAALNSIVSSTNETDATLNMVPSGTYVFATLEDYNAFDSEAKSLGLDDIFTISSPDVKSYTESLTPLNNLSTMSGYFLVVILSIGALVLIVLNIFNVRERKYEVGVLTAIGMKKSKVAMQFIIEILIIAAISVSAGAVIGASASVPVTNSLLQSEITKIEEDGNKIQGSMPGGFGMNGFKDFGNKFTNSATSPADYISEVSSAVNLTVVMQLVLIFLLLTIVSGTVSVIFIMRYEPLKILSNRD